MRYGNPPLHIIVRRHIINMNRKRKRCNVYVTLPPRNIRFTQNNIANAMHVTNNKGCVIKMPLGEVVDRVLRGDIGVEAIPSVFCLSNTWFSLDNRRLWVFKKIQYFLDKSKNTNFSITCLERDCAYVNMSKITTSNGGESIVVRRDPGGTAWKQMEASITDKYPTRKVNKLTGILRTITNSNVCERGSLLGSNVCGRGSLLGLPPNVSKSHLDTPDIKSHLDPPGDNLCDTPPAYHPRRPWLLSHPDYLDLFTPSSEEPYFHGEEYIPEVNDEWYRREADKYYSHADENSPRPPGKLVSDFKFPKTLDIPDRRKAHGRRRRVLMDEEEDIGCMLYTRDY